MAEEISVKNMLQDNSPSQGVANDKLHTPLIAIHYDEFQRSTPRRALEGYLSAVKNNTMKERVNTLIIEIYARAR